MCNQYEKDIGIDFPFCSIYRVKAIFKNKKLNKIINIPLFLNPRYLYYCLKAFINFKPDIIHAHDLPMVPIALILKLIKSVPVIYDMHENYPEALKYFKKKGFFNFLFKNYR